MAIKVVSLGCALFVHILLKSSSDLIASPFIATPHIIAFHAPTSLSLIPSNANNAASVAPHFAYISVIAVPNIVLDSNLRCCFT
ncbi:hypothetical protein ACHQM5_011578 [Ranunculus cassubicifolius]